MQTQLNWRGYSSRISDRYKGELARGFCFKVGVTAGQVALAKCGLAASGHLWWETLDVVPKCGLRQVALRQERLGDYGHSPGASSATNAMSDTFAAHQKRLSEFRQKLRVE